MIIHLTASYERKHKKLIKKNFKLRDNIKQKLQVFQKIKNTHRYDYIN
ncbi:MAG: hypothetical protein UV61_C0019G0039 [Candidatus Gottesmanbacteria bacterium GW2011_GWB1_43_11]|uniref:Uncharacterized protein n=1 Tax=Candidatus Gottesmanbacteria bacterium GW2011_GWB1_43_11 TaxID=1618446 RepID=A0A0G1CHK9_9BACT|nr:MAG: hypothetical protein UV61_C0019G0039 [Candidatus Gottesmanbacteria bacterium GW2011_GWB1_43_11]